MMKDPLFIVAAIACFVVLAVLLTKTIFSTWVLICAAQTWIRMMKQAIRFCACRLTKQNVWKPRSTK